MNGSRVLPAACPARCIVSFNPISDTSAVLLTSTSQLLAKLGNGEPDHLRQHDAPKHLQPPTCRRRGQPRPGPGAMAMMAPRKVSVR